MMREKDTKIKREIDEESKRGKNKEIESGRGEESQYKIKEGKQRWGKEENRQDKRRQKEKN